MKKNLYIIGAALLTFVVSGCEKEFLDKEPTQYLTPKQIEDAAKTDPALLNGQIAGLYSTMYNTGTGGTTGHDDFGQKGYDIYSDMLASDMALAGTNYGWYTGVARYQASTDYTLNAVYMPWRYYYRIINGANTVIDALGGTDAVQTETLQRHIMGQAKAMRGYAYFYLTQFYTAGYGTGQDKILPLYTDAKQPNQPKSTAEEVYNLMIADLTEAVDYLEDFNRSTKDQVDASVAKGLLVYALAARGTTADLNQVVTLTDEVINSGKYRITNENELYGKIVDGKLANPESGFNNVATPSWMWGVDLTLANGLDLVSWWGQVDYYTYSYAWAGDPKTMDKNLQTSIGAKDLRRKQFHSTGRPLYKFFDPARVIGGQRQVTTDYVYMRFEEMILLNAEAKARLGNDAGAKEMLKTLMVQRIEADGYAAYATYLDGLSGQALKNEIFLQTRIELWGEGKAYLALKRNKQSITRGANHLFHAGLTFTWDSDEMTFPIPQAEELNNPVLND